MCKKIRNCFLKITDCSVLDIALKFLMLVIIALSSYVNTYYIKGRETDEAIRELNIALFIALITYAQITIW